MILLLSALTVAQAEVSRHAVVVGSNDGGPDLPQLRYAGADAERLQAVLTELGGFSPESITFLKEPSRDELLAALRDHAWISEQAPEDMFVFYYSGHANAHGLRLGDEVLPYAELRQSINELDAEVRLGVLDACRSGEITRLKGLSLAAPFATDDALQSQGEAWLTASAANEDAQESDHIQGSFFTHYLVSGLRGAADTDDGVVSLDEVYRYTFDQTVQRTGRTDAGAQHPTYKFDLQGKGDLQLTDTRESSARLTIPEGLTGAFTVLSVPQNLPLVEVSRSSRDTSAAVIALPPGSYLLRMTNSVGTAEATVGLSEGANFIVPGDFEPVVRELASRKGDEPTTTTERMDLDDQFEMRLEALIEGGVSLGGQVGDRIVRLASGLSSLEARHDVPSVLAIDPSSLQQLAGSCRVAGPDCLNGDTPTSSGWAMLRYDSGQLAASGELREGIPVGRWEFFEQGGARYTAGEYTDGVSVGTWTWWHASGQVRLEGRMRSGQRSGKWTEFYETGVKKSATTYTNGSPSGRQVEWYPEGQKKSSGELLGEHRYKKWTFWHPDGSRQTVGSYDATGRRTGRWRTWADNGELSSKGNYWQDLKHGEWTFWWETGKRSARGSYNRGLKVGRWESWHPNGHSKSRGDYRENLQDGRWVEWYDNGDLRARGRYEQGERIGRWLTVAPDGSRSTDDHGKVGLLSR
ncbi:MAG: antitoxin component YwqK of YwqJK toxin-antitoxin module [Myxococcota bacterium]|jgi:antitoxin component YwqK of YwqJK toxin-antitoxin module